MIEEKLHRISGQEDMLEGLLKNIGIIVGIIIILAAVHYASAIVLPVLFAISFTILFLPLLRYLRKKGFSDRMSAAITICSFLASFCILILFVLFSFGIFIEALPAYNDEIAMKLIDTQSFFADYHISINALISTITEHTDAFIGAAGLLLLRCIDLIISICLIIILTCFLIIEAPRFHSTLHRASLPVPQVVIQFEELINDMMVYVIIRTKINAATGAGVTIFFYALGIEFALLWGVLTFILSYIPYIGLLLAVIPGLVLGYIHLGITGVVLVVAGVSVINFFAENVLFPSLAGKSLDISPFVVLLSLAFWVFLLGPAASLIAVPLTLFTKLLLVQYNETRWLALLINR